MNKVGVCCQSIKSDRLNDWRAEILYTRCRCSSTCGLTILRGLLPSSTAATSSPYRPVRSCKDRTEVWPECGERTTLSIESRGIVLGGRLLFEHIQAGARNPAFLERLDERGFLDYGAARCVDEVGVGLHEAQGVLVDDVARLFGERRVQGYVVGLGHHFVEGHAGYAALGERFVGDVWVVGDDIQLESLGALSHRAADAPKSEYADGLAVQRADCVGRARRPCVGANVAVQVDDAAVEREKQGHSLIRHFARPQVGDVDHGDALLGGGFHVDDIVAHAGSQHDLALRQRLQHAARHRRLGCDDAVGVPHMRDDFIFVVHAVQQLEACAHLFQRGAGVGEVFGLPASHVIYGVFRICHISHLLAPTCACLRIALGGVSVRCCGVVYHAGGICMNAVKYAVIPWAHVVEYGANGGETWQRKSNPSRKRR